MAEDYDIVDGVAYEVPLVVAQKYRYMVNLADNEKYLASNSLKKIKEAVKARRMTVAYITRNDGKCFVYCWRSGRQLWSDDWCYVPRY